MSEVVPVEVPTVGESITEVQIGRWLFNEGDFVTEGTDLVEIETEKASVQIPAPATGVLSSIQAAAEEFANVGDTIAGITPGDAPAGEPPASQSASTSQSAPASQSAPPSPVPSSSPTSSSPTSGPAPAATSNGAAAGSAGVIVMPAAQRLLDEHGLSAADVPATGPGKRLLKEDVLRYVKSRPQKQTPPQAQPPAQAPSRPAPIAPPPRPAATGTLVAESLPHRMEEVKSMSMLRRTIAARLVEAQQTAALLTTFNEIDMQPVMAIRSKYKDAFAEKHGVKLGFMSFFAKAAVEALRRFPAINAEIRDGSVVYRHYHDIGIAIGGGKGLVVPVLRNVERMSFADVERSIGDFAKLAGENRLQPEDLMGGTFTISNGGVYGSLLSTPIVNPPQSGILGLHSIQQRPVAVDGEVVIRPMMYTALTYDHRIVDGREAVGFLKTIKEVIEDPARLFLEL
ncbi:MAG: 2-oxoglutarate dehydrogenase complex dihydrolipoyllysine-residue succinyltransferase [Planctomycetota bacterium]